ncbi:MAG: tetratricopeptide repeat protein [Myxococcales bacterium]|nr:tetratricopeptide repeat protein [Myxococcales bacterium]
MAADDEPGARGERLRLGGVRLARFVILGALERRPARQLYAAFDEQLDRKVALELAIDSPRAADRARALAGLAHPNVVRVHELGALGPDEAGGDGQARRYLTAEYARGRGIAAWSESNASSGWRALLNMYIGAGRGLAAAHRAGLVHADVPIASTRVDGRPRLRCFDLELVDDDELASARARDQRRLATAIANALGSAGLPRAAPARIHAALRRARSPEPQQRWPDLDALLDALSSTRSRRTTIVAACGLAAVATTAALARAHQAAGADALSCSLGQDRITAIWGADAREAVRAAFSSAPDPARAAATWGRVESALDRVASAWAAVYARVCDEHARGSIRGATLDRRMACLESQRVELAALVEVLHDPRALDEAIPASSQLSAPGDCERLDGDSSARLEPPPPSRAGEVTALRETLTRARAHEDAGLYDRGIELARDALEPARALDYRPLTAEALHQLGSLHERRGEYQEARARLDEALWLAIASGHDALAARAIASRLGVIGNRLSLHREALAQAALASALGERAASLDELRGALAQAEVWYALGRVHYFAGSFDQALALHQRALAAREGLLPRGHPAIAESLRNVGQARFHQHAYPEAAAQLRRALELQRAALGPDHPELAITLKSLSALHRNTRELALALEYAEQALAINERTRGPAHPETGALLSILGGLRVLTGDHDAAADELTRAIEVLERAHGPEHMRVAPPLLRLAEARAGQGQLDEAEALVRRALRQLASLDPTDLTVVGANAQLARLLLPRGRAAEARAVLEATLAHTDEERSLPIVRAELELLLAQALVALGEPEVARPLLDASARRYQELGPAYAAERAEAAELTAALPSIE